MRLAMFGVTGTCGRPLLAAALSQGHVVRALVRAPEKLGRTDPRLEVVKADASDADAVARTVAEADTVVSTLGGFRGPESLSGGTHNILEGMRRHEVRRLILVQGIHLRFPQDHANLGQRMLGAIMTAVSRDIVIHGHLMAEELLDNGLDWTLIRIPRVTTGDPTGNHRLGTLRLGPWSHVTTGDVVSVALQLASVSEWVRRTPMLASGRPIHSTRASYAAQQSFD